MKEKIIVAAVYVLLTILVTWPLIPANNLIIDPVDGLLNTWMLNWIAHLLTSGFSGLANFYNANIFYPYQNTFAFSDLQLPLGIIAIPFILISGEPLWVNNGVLLTNLFLTAFATYLLVRHLTNKTPVSFLAGVISGFSAIHLNYLAHQQSLSVWATVLATLCLLQKRQFSFIFFFAVAVLITPLNLYFLFLIAGVYIFFNKEKFFPVVRLVLMATLIVTPFLLPFWVVSKTFNYRRPLTDAIHFSLQFPDLVNVSVYSRLSSIVPQQSGTPAYLGGVFLAMVLLALRKFKASIWWWLAGLSFILSLGPALHIFRNTVHVGPIPVIPLPYAILYYLLPGFAGFRTPSRWIILTAFALTVAVGVYFAKKINWKWAIILSFLVLAEVNFPFKYHKVPKVSEFPPEQIWLKENLVGAPIIQFPIYGWWDNPGVETETLREYYSTIHYHPMFNGYSGFSPKEWEDRVKWLQKNFPSRETITYLKETGIKLILTPADWEEKIKEFPGLKLAATFPTTNIYELR